MAPYKAPVKPYKSHPHNRMQSHNFVWRDNSSLACNLVKECRMNVSKNGGGRLKTVGVGAQGCSGHCSHLHCLLKYAAVRPRFRRLPRRAPLRRRPSTMGRKGGPQTFAPPPFSRVRRTVIPIFAAPAAPVSLLDRLGQMCLWDFGRQSKVSSLGILDRLPNASLWERGSGGDLFMRFSNGPINVAKTHA